MDAVGVAFGAVTPLGEGESAFSDVAVGAPPRLAIADDEALRAAGLARFAAARIADRSLASGPRILAHAMTRCLADLDRAIPTWRTLRVGVALGTSSGAMTDAEHLLADAAKGRVSGDARMLAYAFPFDRAIEALPVAPVRRAHVLAACASSTIALGLAKCWLDAATCDVVLAGGYDALATFVAAGFVAIGAVTASRPRPFRIGRDGMAVGEGAAVVAMVRADRARSLAPVLVVAGFGASTDAVHVTAPDRTGKGVVAASRAAIAHAQIDASEIGLVSAHGTSTPYNDAAEARAIREVLGARTADVPVHAMKAETGHLFGAAGVSESLSAWRAISAGVAPGTAGDGELDPDASVRVVERAIANDAPAALKLSLAFGGCNAALILRRDPRAEPAVDPRETEILEVVGEGRSRPLPELAGRLGVPGDRLARSDAIVHLVLDALADLAAKIGRERLAGAGLVVGHDVANVATNALFQARIADRGARFAEPRRFPWTSPNACAGEAAIVFGLRASTFSVGGSPGLAGQALEVARDLVASRHAEAMIAVEVSERSAPGDLLVTAYGAPLAERSYATARVIVAK